MNDYAVFRFRGETIVLTERRQEHPDSWSGHVTAGP